MQATDGNRNQKQTKRKYGDDIALIGGFDVPRLLPRGQAKAVRNGVCEVMKNGSIERRA